MQKGGGEQCEGNVGLRSRWSSRVGCYAGADGQSLCSDDWLIRAQGRAVVRGDQLLLVNGPRGIPSPCALARGTWHRRG